MSQSPRKVIITELTAFDSVTPLAAGYLQSYAALDPQVRDNYAFETVTFPISRAEDDIVRALERRDGDIYAFSCYVWNSRLVRRLTARLLADKPGLPVLLGGPQVMHQGARYLHPTQPSVSVCNGEGEITFQHYLAQHLFAEPDLSNVRGLSFFRDGKLITTPDQARIKNLDDIPSPYLTGIIKPFRYPYALFETNRGCPFKCAYCYWGGAVGAKVNKMGMERLKAELEWFSKSGVVYVYIVDANWGMLKRDIELSRHFVACQKKTGLPRFIHYSNAKNSPTRTLEIAEILRQSTGQSSQPLALQTVSERALVDINRSNIKNDVYLRLQTRLNEMGSSSFIELIWPLPGETLRSFKDGLELLCAGGAQSLVVYPLLLMNNVELMERRDEFGLLTWLTNDDSGESEIVIATRDIDESECLQGWAFALGTFMLYSMRGLFHLARYLHTAEIRSYADLIDDFVAYIDETSDPLLVRLRDHSLQWPNIELSTIGHVTYYCCHHSRDHFDRTLADFVSKQPWWHDGNARALFEIDLLNRPYVYRKPTIAPKQVEFHELNLCDVVEDGYIVDIPIDLAERELQLYERDASDDDSIEHSGTRRVKVCHWREQMFPAHASTPMHRKEKSCYAAIMLIESILPHWETTASTHS